MGLFHRKRSGALDVIRCDEENYLIWKWRPAGSRRGESARENAIRFGSLLRVKEGSVAVFLCNRDNQQVQEFIEGPYDGVLETGNLPVLADVFEALYGGGGPFPAEVYFINLARAIAVPFGVPFFEVFDARVSEQGVPVAVRGTLYVRIADYREFIRLHRLDAFDLPAFQRELQGLVAKLVKPILLDAPARYHVPVTQLERQLAAISASAETVLREALRPALGVEVARVDISAIEIDRTSDGYRAWCAAAQNAASTT